MSQFRLAAFVVCLLTPAVAPAADASVYLYLQPPADPASVTMAVASLNAVDSTGAGHPLEVKLREIGPAAMRRQRLLASGRLPAGSYAALSLAFEASNPNAAGQVAFADESVRIDFPFVVTPGRASVFWINIGFEEPGEGQQSRRPVLSVVAPPEPAPHHAGFVTNAGSDTITIFDTNRAQAVAAIDTCAGPAGIVLDQRRRRAYVACPADDEIRSIDVPSGELLERARTSPGDRPRELALTPDGRTLVTVNSGSHSISFFDAGSLTREDRLEVGTGPTAILMDGAGRRAFVFNSISSSVSIVDVASRTVAATLSTEAAPVRGELNRRGDRLYVIHERSPLMTVLDPRELTVIMKTRLRTGVSAIEVDSVRDLVCIAGTSDRSIDFYDPNALLPLYSMRTGTGVSYLTTDSESNRLYILSSERPGVIVARLGDRQIVSEVDVGERPYRVAVMGAR